MEGGKAEAREDEDYIFSDGIVWPLLFLLIAISYTCDYDGAEETILFDDYGQFLIVNSSKNQSY